MKVTTPTYTVCLPLQTTKTDERELHIRMDAARQLYNAALSKGLKIISLIKQSKEWTKAKKISNSKQRSELFKQAIQKYNFTKSLLEQTTCKCKNNTWIKYKLDAHTQQKIAERAFLALKEYLLRKRGKPKFKKYGTIHSVESKTNISGIKYRDGTIVWKGLDIPIIFDSRDKTGWQRQILSDRTKFCRIIKKEMKGRWVFYVHLIQEGTAPQRKNREIGSKIVGLDIGPSTIAAISDDDAILEPFCSSISHPWNELRKQQRQQDRSRKVTNPDNYNEDGTVKKGSKKWKRSNRYKRRQAKIRENQRKLASERNRSHGELVNRIVRQGILVKTEGVSYKGWQKSWFGKSMTVTAPSMFQEKLKKRLEAVGGELLEIRTYKTKLSQYDHTTNDYEKKALSERIHRFRDGQTKSVQRDLYSAFLARHCSEDKLDTRKANLAFPAMEPLLRQAVSREVESTSGRGFPLTSDKCNIGRVDCLSNSVTILDEAVDVVSDCEITESYRESSNYTERIPKTSKTVLGKVQNRPLAPSSKRIAPDRLRSCTPGVS